MTRIFEHTDRRAVTATAALAAAMAALPCPAAATGPYATGGICAGFPRVELQTPPGYCVALLADGASDLRFPRRLLEVSPGRFWLVDMGSWEPGRGRLLEFSLAAPGERAAPPTFTVLAEKLDRPLGLVLGPDGRVWLGEAGRISRILIGPLGVPVKPQPVIDGLPATGAHPLKEIVFGAGGKLYINVGSASDACRDDSGAQAVPCPETDGAQPRAAVYEATLGPDFALQSIKPFARGLRNSVALAFIPGPNLLLQGENSIDYPDETAPSEELNVLHEGAHYGWPYCFGARTPARGYEGRFDCGKTEPAAVLWPAHAAPLHMLAVPAAAANPFAGQLVVAWHGYRAGGHRVVSFKLDAHGRPSGAAQVWIGGWTAAPGVRPLGAPTGMAIDAFGRLLVVEDRHKTLLMLVREPR
jgi:glucose/arabinose dehydrogenase